MKKSYSACTVIKESNKNLTAKKRSSAPISADNCGGLKTRPWFHEIHRLNVSALCVRPHSYHTKANIAFTAHAPVTVNRRRHTMLKNNELFDKMYHYQRIMSWVRNLLNKSLITKAEYAKIDTMMAKKYGVSSCSIFRWNPRKIVDLSLDRR